MHAGRILHYAEQHVTMLFANPEPIEAKRKAAEVLRAKIEAELAEAEKRHAAALEKALAN